VNTPERFRGTCVFCNELVDVRKPGVYQLASGWVKNRGGAGGANALHLMERQPRWACRHCMEKKLKGQAQYQLDLFA